MSDNTNSSYRKKKSLLERIGVKIETENVPENGLPPEKPQENSAAQQAQQALQAQQAYQQQSERVTGFNTQQVPTGGMPSNDPLSFDANADRMMGNSAQQRNAAAYPSGGVSSTRDTRRVTASVGGRTPAPEAPPYMPPRKPDSERPNSPQRPDDSKQDKKMPAGSVTTFSKIYCYKYLDYRNDIENILNIMIKRQILIVNFAESEDDQNVLAFYSLEGAAKVLDLLYVEIADFTYMFLPKSCAFDLKNYSDDSQYNEEV